MGKETIEILVEGGKATAAPPLGPSLAPLKVNVGLVVAEINKKTAEMAGMKVPVKVTVDKDTKTFDIEVGTPPVSALIKKELKIDKGSSEAGKARVGDLSDEQIKRVSKIKFGSDEKRFIDMIKGTARSMGVTVGAGAVSAEERAKEKADKVAHETAVKEGSKEKQPAAEKKTDDKKADAKGKDSGKKDTKKDAKKK